MPSNSIDIGALQGAIVQAVGAMQPATGGSMVSDSITLGVLGHVGPTCVNAELAAITLGSLDATVPTAVAGEVAAIAPGVLGHLGLASKADEVAAIAPGVLAGSAPSGGTTDSQAIELNVDAGVVLRMAVTEGATITLGSGLHAQCDDHETFGAVRRGKSAVTVTGPSGKVRVH